jgi:tellurite resistance protein TehA-like permease
MILPTTPAAARMPTLTRTQARAIWLVIAAALVAAVVGALVGAAAVPASADPGLGTVFLVVAAVLVPADLVISWFVTSRIRRRPPPGAPPDAVAATQVIVGSAIALGAGSLCCIFFFVSRQPLLLLLVLPCAAVLLRWFPSPTRWAALLPAPAPGEARRSTMMRE